VAERAIVRTHRGLAGVEAITGVVVVIDVFRASNTIIALLAAGAGDVALVADMERARTLKRMDPERPLLGERGGIAPDDFDGGNSPSKAGMLVRPGDRPILTTSAGTQAVARLTSADTVLFASFANATAVVEAVRHLEFPSVTMLPMGLEARAPAVEDDEAAAWIAGLLLEDRRREFSVVRDRVLAGDGAGRLRRLGQTDDLAMCVELDSQPLVPVVVPGDPPCAVKLAIGYNPSTLIGDDSGTRGT
jgi:2-phosphosulfolactate phosphatase